MRRDNQWDIRDRKMTVQIALLSKKKLQDRTKSVKPRRPDVISVSAQLSEGPLVRVSVWVRVGSAAGRTFLVL